MHDLSPTDVEELASHFGLDITPVEVEDIRELANASLDGIEALPNCLPGDGPTYPDRSWSEPTDNTDRSLTLECAVPPSQDHDGRLTNTTVGIKDLIAVGGLPMACGSAALQEFVPQSDATVVERLRAAGAAITAKTNMDEFAGGAWGTTGVNKPILNPHDETRFAGGSSGGSAVAVATDRVDVALGTDTGGSIRIPASYCGVVGLKPSHGLVPLTGVVEASYTQDHVGPLASSVADAARILEVLAGSDTADPASLRAAGRDGYHTGGYVDAVEDPPSLSALTIGVLDYGFRDPTDDCVVDRTVNTVERVEDAGATVRQVTIDHVDLVNPAKSVIALCEIADHWRNDGVHYRSHAYPDPVDSTAFGRRTASNGDELGTYFKSMLVAGEYLLDAHGQYYDWAQAVRNVVRADFEAQFADVDVLVSPTTPTLPPKIDEAGTDVTVANLTRPANLTELPAVSVPNGTVDGLPVGLQCLGPLFGETTLLGTASRIESVIEA